MQGESFFVRGKMLLISSESITGRYDKYYQKADSKDLYPKLPAFFHTAMIRASSNSAPLNQIMTAKTR